MRSRAQRRADRERRLEQIRAEHDARIAAIRARHAQRAAAAWDRLDADLAAAADARAREDEQRLTTGGPQVPVGDWMSGPAHFLLIPERIRHIRALFRRRPSPPSAPVNTTPDPPTFSLECDNCIIGTWTGNLTPDEAIAWLNQHTEAHRHGR